MLRSIAVCASRALAPRAQPVRLVASQAAAAAQQHQQPRPVATLDGDLVNLHLPDGEHHRFPYMWLRDNCRCPSCFNQHQMSRIIFWDELDTSVRPADVQAEDGKLNVTWSDGHSSQFNFDWLKERSFLPEDQKKWLQTTYKLPKVAWDASKYSQILQRFKFGDLMNNNEQLRAWLEAMAQYGVAIVYDTPPKEESLVELGEKVMFPRRTHYGLQFHIKETPGTTNVAYLKDKLEMHTDLMYYEYKPGINMLHCLVQTEGYGGENLLVDAYHVSEQLKRTHPEAYHVLSTVPVTWADIGEDRGKTFYSLYRAPVICNDMFGEFSRINYSQPQRSSHFNASIDQIAAWYKAYAVFTKAIHDRKNQVRFKTLPGEILTFDNIRLVHARDGYDDKPGNERHIVGMFMDWDEVFSRLRVLRKDAGLIEY